MKASENVRATSSLIHKLSATLYYVCFCVGTRNSVPTPEHSMISNWFTDKTTHRAERLELEMSAFGDVCKPSSLLAISITSITPKIPESLHARP